VIPATQRGEQEPEVRKYAIDAIIIEIKTLLILLLNLEFTFEEGRRR
jgi:hypothetical protein